MRREQVKEEIGMTLTIGEKIGILRKERHITQTQLAEYLVLTPQTVSRWEVGNGAPEITLLPKIAAFFGVSIDELFEMDSMERAENLVVKYSVLREDRYFQEAMECVNLQMQMIDDTLKDGAKDTAVLEGQRDKLEALKLHLWLQQGREAYHRALEIADSFVEKTEGKPEHPWYLRMRLQRNQLCAGMESGRGVLAECGRNFRENPNALTLQLYFCMLSDLFRYEEILSLQETESSVGGIIFPPSPQNMDIWWVMFHAAAETGREDFVEKHMPSVLEICSKEDEFDFLWGLESLYREGHEKEKAAIKKHLLALLPELKFDKYRLENSQKAIEQW